MKDYYMIGEISRLYGIGTDSLMYYEKLGILTPARGENNYRLYSLNDIYRLNIIRSLRDLGFSMARIKEYILHQSLATTEELLKEEQELVGTKMKKLREQRAIIKKRLAALEQIKFRETGGTEIIQYPERRCVQLKEYITRDEEMDILIKKLHKRHENSIKDFGSLVVGGRIAMEDVAGGLANVYRSVFFIMEEGESWDFTIPAGNYASFYYRGGYDKNLEYIKAAIAGAEKLGYRPDGDPFELYESDNRITVLPEEFLTEIQLPVAEI